MAKPVAADFARVSDRSLDEFARAGNDGDGDAATAESDPAVPTMRWSPEGDACADCGATAPRLWHAGDDDVFVCADCKEW
ncbi:hypothetical protein EI982_11680 [Haloplanus rallus]|jgi:hypothetical protein|uniref:GATA-type domain-containing protein n=1 Tax=Haloplanus rallus TaxID=1816183 RepID=A0A6B9F9Y7_9EURY|nr:MULTISPECIES: hypothetical protein [Haloplanus]QGX95407.1 hypothetical protein EI982_11680 [Haloplanus rallus]